ncbi:MAG: CRISPR-associated endonuclease Cas3'', partial [Gammaproteobacteria bacterium]|nr:CRISPR-associated endonuclease Cas3'' [Gammaproteobacteria bacterium]
RERHLIVIATQTLEVGADVDAEYLVSEACGVRALTQRLGRLNRLGRHPGARAIYVHGKPGAKGKRPEGAVEWPVYGREPEVVLDRFFAALSDPKLATLDLSPRRIASILGRPLEDSGRAPEILPGLLWEWIKTTTPPRDEAPVEPYFSGIAGPEYSVTVIWRAHVPPDGDRLWPRARDREAVAIPIREARETFGADEELVRLRSDRVTVETCMPRALRSGDTLILPVDRGLLDEFGWNPSSDAPVFDVSLRERGLPLDAAAMRRLCGVSPGVWLNRALGVGEDHDDIDSSDRAEAIEQILTSLRGATGRGWEPGEWDGFVGDLERRVVSPPDEVPRLPTKSLTAASESRSDERDEMSLAATATELEPHGRAVAARALRIAQRVGLGEDLTDAVESGGLLHDVGKADRRFQRWLDPGGNHMGVALAKSSVPRDQWETARAASGWPRGGRHEALSTRLVARMMESDPAWDSAELRDLVLHLVVSHHGHGRPLVRPVEDGTTMTVATSIEGIPVEATADLSTVDWEQPARFRRLNDRFGPWGLALLEAIVRQADHAVSSGADADVSEAAS